LRRDRELKQQEALGEPDSGRRPEYDRADGATEWDWIGRRVRVRIGPRDAGGHSERGLIAAAGLEVADRDRYPERHPRPAERRVELGGRHLGPCVQVPLEVGDLLGWRRDPRDLEEL